jgi:hypothetical protein
MKKQANKTILKGYFSNKVTALLPFLQNIKAGPPKGGNPAFMFRPAGNLCFADAEHLGAAGGTGTLGCGLAVLHLNGLRVAHFLLFAAFHAVCLHLFLL